MGFIKLTRFAAKGCLYANIKVRDRSVGLFLTHTQASYGHIPDPSVLIRKGQFENIGRFIKSKQTDFVLLFGDFNVDQPSGVNHSWEYVEMIKNFENLQDLIHEKYQTHPSTFDQEDRHLGIFI